MPNSLTRQLDRKERSGGGRLRRGREDDVKTVVY